MVAPAAAQQIDLSHGGPLAITADQGIEWHQVQQEVIAVGNAKAVRDNVTVTADRLIAWYRKKGGAAASGAAQPAQAGLTGDTDTGGNEVYRVKAEGHVHIFTQTDQIQGDVATYDLDQAVLVVTGHDLKLTTPTQVLTARDDMEYWSQRHMAVARGDAVAVTNDGRRLQADTLVAYTTAGSATASPGASPGASQAAGQAATRVAATQVAATAGRPAATQDPLASSGKLEKVEAYGHVVVRTVTDMVTGDRAVYVPDTGIARVAGQVRITRGQNQLDGSEAEVDLKTGISRLIAGNTGRVQGLVMPNDQSGASSPKPASPAPHAGKHP
jgi:lipopolysaccharide export system protein LptA